MYLWAHYEACVCGKTSTTITSYGRVLVLVHDGYKRMRRVLKGIIRFIRDHGALAFVKFVNRCLRSLTASGHKVQMTLEWGLRPNPEWFDHFIDQHEQWHRTRIPFPWERGIFNLLAMKPESKVLELCCGDGFNAHHFYSIRAGSVTSLDFDPKAIAHARKHFKAPNVTYLLADIRKDLPPGPFDNIIWDAAIEHFTEEEIASIIRQIRGRLRDLGTLSGYTLIEEQDHKGHHEHEYEFKSREDLARVLKPHFKNVLVLQTDYPTRKNLYYFASDAPLPFDPEWQSGLRV